MKSSTVRAVPWVGVALLALATGCGASEGQPTTVTEAVTLEPTRFLAALGAEASAVMRTPSASIEELDEARRAARGDERRALTRDLVAAYVRAWADAEDRRERRRHRRRADRLADAGMRGSRDPSLDAQLDFAKLWMSFVASERPAGRRAERFTRRYAQTGGALVGIAWMIRGEVALEAEAYDEAIAAFRFALGQVGTPLYAYALYRTGVTHRVQGDDADANQAMGEVAQMGCEADAPALTLRVANVAATSMGVALRREPGGALRPSSCPAVTREAEPEGWRPAE